MLPDGSSQTRLTTDAMFDARPAWSPDGAKIAFESQRDGDNAIYVMNANGSGQTRVSPGTGVDDREPAWSPDGTKIAFATSRSGDHEIYVMNANGTGMVNLTNSPGTVDVQPAWSPDGARIAFVRAAFASDYNVFVMNANGTGQASLTPTSPNTSEIQPNWSPDGGQIAYVGGPNGGSTDIYAMNADGSAKMPLTSDPAYDLQPAWSPDGSKIAFDSARAGRSDVYVMNFNGTSQTQLTTSTAGDSDPDWQRLPFAGYPRPKGATPLRVPLVPAFRQCTAPNSTHGAPLNFPSCRPPAQASSFVTVGTPDANEAAANSQAFLLLKVKATAPEDVLITAKTTDVRCTPSTDGSVCTSANAADGLDYSGQLQANANLRITDRYNGPSLDEPATLIDIPFPVTENCVNTGDTGVGATCTANTTVQAMIPNQDWFNGKRVIVEFGQVMLFDGGADGVVSSTPNTLFMTQGIFVP